MEVGDIIGGIINEFGGFVLVNDRVRVNHAAPAGLLPAQTIRAAMHTIQARIKLVALARLAILQQKHAPLAAFPEWAALLCNNRQRLRTAGVCHDTCSNLLKTEVDDSIAYSQPGLRCAFLLLCKHTFRT